MDVGDAFFVVALVQVLQRGEVGQVGLEFITECWPDGSGIAIGGLSYQMVWSLIFVDTKEELSAEHGIVLLDGHVVQKGCLLLTSELLSRLFSVAFCKLQPTDSSMMVINHHHKIYYHVPLSSGQCCVM